MLARAREPRLLQMQDGAKRSIGPRSRPNLGTVGSAKLASGRSFRKSTKRNSDKGKTRVPIVTITKTFRAMDSASRASVPVRVIDVVV